MNTLRHLDIIIVLLGVITVCVIISTIFESRRPGFENGNNSIVLVWMKKEVKDTLLSAEIGSTTQVPISKDEDNKECPTIIERDMWNAQPPVTIIEKNNSTTGPLSFAIISHTGTAHCLTQSACTLRVRLLQTLHIESFGWDDIGYSFLIGGDGNVYVGRGWTLAGAFAYGWNYKSVGISFIGTFNDVEPSEKMMSTARKLLYCGKAGGFLSNDVKVLGHRQVSQTLSPGDKLYALIKKWPEWQTTPSP